jgi:crotonobetainyl-CoA:carnitine CoA-transferase CaiB-like acyl-CoA transferase
MADESRGALAGLRVLDISTFLAGPQISAILGDFGADVVKVEPPTGEVSRNIGAQRNGASLMWALTSRNKRTISLDLTTERGRDVFRELVGRADVVVENYPVEQLRAWGLSYADLCAINSALVMVSVSCYGNTGPLADRPGAGTLAEAFGGLTHMTGEASGPPMLPSIPLGDSLSALSGVIGTLIACYHNKVNGGGGQHVDVSFYEPVLTLLQPTIIAYDPTADEAPPMRTGSRISTGVPRNVYRTADDRWLVLSGTTDRQVARILKIVGADTPEGRAKFALSVDRLANADELDALVAGWIAAHSLDDVLAVMADNRVPAAPVNDVPSLLRDPHIRARGSIVAIDDATMGRLHMVPASPRLDDTPAEIRFPGAAIGAFNEQVYAEWLGYDRARLDELRDEGVI